MNVLRFFKYHYLVSQRHLRNVNMTYSEHFVHSSKYSALFGACSIKAALHALFPSFYVTSSTSTILNEFQKIKDNNIKSQ